MLSLLYDPEVIWLNVQVIGKRFVKRRLRINEDENVLCGAFAKSDSREVGFSEACGGVVSGSDLPSVLQSADLERAVENRGFVEQRRCSF